MTKISLIKYSSTKLKSISDYKLAEGIKEPHFAIQTNVYTNRNWDNDGFQTEGLYNNQIFVSLSIYIQKRNNIVFLIDLDKKLIQKMIIEDEVLGCGLF